MRKHGSMERVPFEIRQQIYKAALAIPVPLEPSRACDALRTFHALRSASKLFRDDLSTLTMHLSFTSPRHLLCFTRYLRDSDLALVENISIQHFVATHPTGWSSRHTRSFLFKFRKLRCLRLHIDRTEMQPSIPAAISRIERMIEPMVPFCAHDVVVTLVWERCSSAGDYAGLASCKSLELDEQSASKSLIFTSNSRSHSISYPRTQAH